MKQLIYQLCLLLAVSGCGAPAKISDAVQADYIKVKRFDRINMAEARVIAQNACLAHENCSKGFDLRSPDVYEGSGADRNSWLVRFKPKLFKKLGVFDYPSD